MRKPNADRIRNAVTRWARARWVEFVSGHRYIRPTLPGLLFIAVTLLVGFAAMNTAAQLLYLMFSLMCAFMILSALQATANLRGIAVTREAPRVVEARVPAVVAITLDNGKKRTPTMSIRTLDRMPNGTIVGAAYFDQVPPRTRERQTYECLFPRRGIYRLGSIDIATLFPFGLIMRTFSVPAEHEVLVLPATIDVDRAMRVHAAELGEVEENRKGLGTGIYNIRPMVFGDARRDVHWKVSARRGELMVREYEAEEQRSAVVVLDNRGPENPPEALRLEFERAVVLAGSAISWLCERGYQVALHTASGTIAPGTGPSHLLRCRRALALVELLGPGALSPRTPNDPSQTVFRIDYGSGSASGGRGIIGLHTALLEEELTAALLGPKDEPAVPAPPAPEVPSP